MSACMQRQKAFISYNLDIIFTVNRFEKYGLMMLLVHKDQTEKKFEKKSRDVKFVRMLCTFCQTVEVVDLHDYARK